jgi:hypothetical protein
MIPLTLKELVIYAKTSATGPFSVLLDMVGDGQRFSKYTFTFVPNGPRAYPSYMWANAPRLETK